MPWLIDGMNVIGSRPDGWWRDRHGAMERLVEQLDSWASTSGERATVVFERPPDPPIAAGAVEVAAAPRAEPDSADDEIVELLQDRGADGVRVVTSDATLARRVRALGATVEGAGGFRDRLDELG